MVNFYVSSTGTYHIADPYVRRTGCGLSTDILQKTGNEVVGVLTDICGKCRYTSIGNLVEQQSWHPICSECGATIEKWSTFRHEHYRLTGDSK